MMFKRTTEMKL